MGYNNQGPGDVGELHICQFLQFSLGSDGNGITEIKNSASFTYLAHTNIIAFQIDTAYLSTFEYVSIITLLKESIHKHSILFLHLVLTNSRFRPLSFTFLPTFFIQTTFSPREHVPTIPSVIMGKPHISEETIPGQTSCQH